MSSPGPGTPVKQLGVATHHTPLSPPLELGRQSGHAHRLHRPPLSVLRVAFLFPLLSSAQADLTAVTREGYSLCASLNDLCRPPLPRPNTRVPQPRDTVEKTN